MLRGLLCLKLSILLLQLLLCISAINLHCCFFFISSRPQLAGACHSLLLLLRQLCCMGSAALSLSIWLRPLLCQAGSHTQHDRAVGGQGHLLSSFQCCCLRLCCCLICLCFQCCCLLRRLQLLQHMADPCQLLLLLFNCSS
jgi:hypothetical protein